MNFDKCPHECNHHHNQDTECFHHPGSLPACFQSTPTPTTGPTQQLVSFASLEITGILYKWKHAVGTLLWVLPSSVNFRFTMLLRVYCMFIHFCGFFRGFVVFVFIISYCGFVSQFVGSPGCVQRPAPTNKAVTSIYVQVVANILIYLR